MRRPLALMVLMVVFLAGLGHAQNPILPYQNGFSGSGVYTRSQLANEWNNPAWNNGVDEGRVTLVNGVLQTAYPSGQFGPQNTGAQWKMNFEPVEEAYVSYDIKFNEGFDFVKGGKLPGLAGGAANTGANKPTGTDGWSSRIMWRDNGQIVQYVYHPDQPGNFGQDLAWNRQFVSGRWYHVETRVKMNSLGQRDGIIQSWLDGELVLDKRDLRFRDVSTLAVDVFYFSTFFGGDDPTWATTKDEAIQFDNFQIATNGPGWSPSVPQAPAPARFPQITLDPELYFLVKDANSSVADVSLRDEIVREADRILNLDTLVTSYKVTTDDAVRRRNLVTASALLVYRGQVLVVRGEQLSAQAASATDQLIDVISDDLGMPLQVIDAASLVSDDLFAHLVLAESDLVFVLADDATLSEGAILDSVANEALYAGVNLTPDSFKRASEVNLADLATQFTVFIDRGQALLIAGDQATGQAVQWGADIALILANQYDIRVLQVLSSQMNNTDFRGMIGPTLPLVSLPDVLFVVDDQSPASDVVLAVAIQQAVAERSPVQVQAAPARLNSEVTKADLEGRVTVFIYQGEPVIIVGISSPYYQFLVASAITQAFYQERGLFATTLQSSDVTSDDLRSTVTPPVPPSGGVQRPELLFVTEGDAKFGDQGLLTMFADLLDEELDLNSMVNGYAFKTENDLDAWNNDYDYRVTVFAYKGELLIITGSHSPASHRILSDEIARVAYEELGIEAQQRYSSEVFGALRWAVTLNRARFNSLSYSLGLDTDIPFTSTLDFFSEDADGNTSGELALALVNLSADGQYTLQPLEEPVGEAYGFVEVTGTQITELYLRVDADKIETWSMINDSLQKTLVFDIPGYATSYEDYESIGTLSVTIRIDSIANLNQSYKIDLTREGAVVGSFKIDATDAFPSFAAVRQLSLRGRVFRALGDLQPDGGLVAKGNAGTFVTPIINGNYFLTLFHEITDHIFYSVSGVEAYNSTYPPAEEPPFPLEHDLVINQTQRGAYVNLIDVPRQLQFPHFADDDLDGVPDQIDACEDTSAAQDVTTVTTVFNPTEPYVFNDNGTLPIINTSLADLVDVLGEANTALLASGILTVASGPVTYHQYLRFNESNGPDAFNSGLKMVYGENEADEVGNFLFANDGDIVFEYEVDFENGLSSSLDSQGNLLDLNGSIITLLGMPFTITSGLVTPAILTLNLMGGEVSDTLVEGETKTYIVNGKSYEVSIGPVIPNLPYRVDVRINGEQISASRGYEYALADGSRLGVIDIRHDPVPSASFVFAPIFITFADSFADNTFEDSPRVNEAIENARVSMRGVVSGNTFELNTIKYRLTADSRLGDAYIKLGKGLRSETDEPEGMLTPNWDIVFASDNQITFTLHDGVSEPVTGFTIQLTSGSFSHTDNTITTTTAVDSFGCSCTQKNCAAEGLGCIEEFGQAICAATCTDGVQNGGEAGVDCGMTCGVSCGPNACFNPGQCTGTAPGYCSGTLEVVNNCQQCGCPSTQICTGLNTCANTLPESCSNGVLDGDERGVDCGGSCFGFCPGDSCDSPGLCLPAMPAFCSLGSTGGTLADAFELRGAAGTYYQVATGSQRSDVLDALDRANLNLLIVDAKTEDGLLGYLSTVGPTANPNWPEGEPVKEAIGMVHAEGLFVGTRVSVGQDGSWLSANPQDQIVGDWVNLCSQAYGDYISAIVAELAGLGPDVIVLDFFRGPDVADGSTGPLTCAGGDAYSTALVALADRLEQSAKTANPSVQVTLTLFGRIPTSPNDIIGQTMDLADEVDFIMPMLFKSQMSPLTVSEAVNNFVDAGVAPARIRPFIQAFPPFATADEMIKDVNDLAVRGASGFVFWSFIDTLPTSSVWDDVGFALYQVEGEVQAQQVVLNCQQCGCPTGFTCSASGACLSPPPPPVDPCTNGVEDGDERGIDCGGQCGNICPSDQCSELGSCLGAQPLQCTLDAQLQNNCQTCGCPTGFSCQPDGQCTQVLELVGKKCLNGDFFTHNAPMDCETFANETGLRTELAQDYIHVRLIGNLPSWWGKKGMRSAIKRWVRSTSVCLGEDDYGCVPKEFSCPYMAYAEDAKPLVAQEIHNSIKATGRHAIPGLLKNWPFNFHLRVGVDLSKFPLETTYECEPQIISATTLNDEGIPEASTCQPYIENGESSQKIDLVFIGDRMNDAELRANVDRLLDYDSVRVDTRIEGLFSREPFSSRRKNFNVWYLPLSTGINYNYEARYGFVPEYRDVMEASNLCPQRDMVVMVTRTPFRSHCSLGYPGPCMISLTGEQFPGRLLVHELGHGLGMLGDEYYNFVEETGTSEFSIIDGFFAQENINKNCQPSQEGAQSAWGSLVGKAPEIGFFNSCGGDCGEACASYLRPTINSIMNQQDCKEGTEQITQIGDILTCRFGPPFRPWYAVNEQQLAKVLDIPAVTPQTSAGIIRGLLK